MSDLESESFFENDWDDRGDVAWNEFDWERYLRCQDDLLHRYLAFYESLKNHPERIDEVAHLMGWDTAPRQAEPLEEAQAAANANLNLPAPVSDQGFEPYTVHRNPVYIATKAIFLSLKRSWERIADDGAKIPQPLALAMQTSLFRAEEQATLGIQALDLGDFAMAVSLFKRALRELNETLALAGRSDVSRHFADWRETNLPRVFDLREIWLRVINECRHELGRRVDNET